MHSKWLAIALVPLAISCSKPNDPKSVATGYLEAIKSGKAAEAQKSYCLVTESSPLTVLTGFTIGAESPGTIEGQPYTAVAATLETSQTRLVKVNDAPVSQPIANITVEVWDSEAFFNRYVASIAQINQMGDRVTALTGTPSKTVPTPTRDKVNSAQKCVYLKTGDFSNARF